jgi:glutamine amidotransferase
MKIGILNSGGYNINSIKFALNRLKIDDVVIIKSPEEFEKCDKIIIPGVGHAKTAMDLLHSQGLIECVKNTIKPVLGICLGMQIMFNFSEEGYVDCLGIFDGKIVKLPENVRIPQMGWNKLVNGKYEDEFVYFANSYYATISEYTESYIDYENIKISAIVRMNNFVGCQFHPEKSGKVGEKILSDFLYDKL